MKKEVLEVQEQPKKSKKALVDVRIADEKIIARLPQMAARHDFMASIPAHQKSILCTRQLAAEMNLEVIGVQ